MSERTFTLSELISAAGIQELTLRRNAGTAMREGDEAEVRNLMRLADEAMIVSRWLSSVQIGAEFAASEPEPVNGNEQLAQPQRTVHQTVASIQQQVQPARSVEELRGLLTPVANALTEPLTVPQIIQRVAKESGTTFSKAENTRLVGMIGHLIRSNQLTIDMQRTVENGGERSFRQVITPPYKGRGRRPLPR